MNRQAFKNWIREVRGNMSREEFGKKICRFKNTKDGRVCTGYHRNEICNWEKGENLNKMNTETVISIALLEFDQMHEESEDVRDYAQSRYQHVKRRLQEFLQQELYSRNIHDALLILVCRNILTFEEVLAMEPELNQMVLETDMDPECRRSGALKRVTKRISSSLCSAGRIEDIRQIVWNARQDFYTGIRAFGERMKVCFDSRKRYVADVSFEDAVKIYAPNYRDSYARIYSNNGISRQWMIDLCVHLRFNRAEIEQMLSNAYLAPLSTDSADEEFYYREQNGLSIGSAAWYQYMELEYPYVFSAHYAAFRSMELKEKIVAAVLLSVFVNEVDSEESVVPVDDLLESFLKYNYAKNAYKAAIKMQERAAECIGLEDGIQILTEELRDNDSVSVWIDYLTSGLCSLSPGSVAMNKVYQDYCRECRQYYQYPGEVTKELSDDSDLIKMRYLAALLYTIFTGRYYMGDLSNDDLEEIKKQFEDRMQDWKISYCFINQFLTAFLSGNILYKDKQGGYYCISGRKTFPMNWEMVCAEIWELYVSLFCTN